MSRYVILRRPPPQAYWDQTMPPLAHPTVYPVEATNTGLLNADGAPIYRMPDAIGFLADHEGHQPRDDDGRPECGSELVPLHHPPTEG